ncbi:actin-like protein Arp6 [Trametes versicolor FP-101664 SS1]|uniref:actin-like protein Arp6 n=1 Tax=Trametes versicolor (strain FP-101664) TaxID=717944 RepID=UPI000462182F|nr:actin-like protein Arp6 [Trametes versicolor FP-101664 SS1]EIW59290.1 actin-like protein Arp6 [Trametes versicolor FP-101664 SS1]
MNSSNTVLLDNGASTIKAGILGVHNDQPLIIPNAVVRSKGDNSTYIGHELVKCRDFTSLRFRLPFEKGFLVDWDAQKAVWDGLFSDVLRINTSEASLLITEPYFNLPNIQDVYDQFIFEEYEFKAYHKCTPASLVPHGRLLAQPSLPSPECLLVIDSGFSFTHVIPVLKGAVVWDAVKRIDVGGKLLTNHLKEIVSFRQWNMMDETHIINEVKEACCFVSEDFKRDLEACRVQFTKNRITQEYIFPDYAANRPGRIRRPGEPLDEAEQTLTMNNERFAVPEILFHPTDIGLDQAGISATVAASISLLPQDLQGLFWANIALIGGTTALPGLRARLTSELRSLAPIDCEVAVYASERPELEAYRAAAAFAARPEFSQCVVTREEYQEMGSSACRRKFRDWKPSEKEPAARGRETAKGRGQKGRVQQEDEEDASPPPTKKPTRGRGRGRGSARRQA